MFISEPIKNWILF